ncbi:MAG TPA: hypothetical protein VNU28_04070 [Solirubrobacteraceae bacterium]|jgi:hypothetical protein|nr:hypothetical protein [Solirubrobacteraceae bacterium]
MSASGESTARSKVKANRYAQMIERVFLDSYKAGSHSVDFTRDQLGAVAGNLKIALPKNLGDTLYAFRYRVGLPQAVLDCQPDGLEWAIFPNGPSKYRFAAVPFATIAPTRGLTVTKIPDATPGLIEKYSLNDEQALLAKLRYNRLLDIYTGVTSYSLQNHLRTAIAEGQLETDEVYVGVDRRGAHYVFPIQAKGGSDHLSVVQIWQDFKMCAKKFPDLIARPIAAQFLAGDVIALFFFEWDGGDGITIAPGAERHYKLVSPEDLSDAELAAYARRPIRARSR